jgi:hypothetical protein
MAKSYFFPKTEQKKNSFKTKAMEDLLKELSENQRKEFMYYHKANFTLIKQVYNRKDYFTTFKPNTEICFFAHHPKKGTFLITGDAPMEWINNAINDNEMLYHKTLEINTQLSLF